MSTELHAELAQVIRALEYGDMLWCVDIFGHAFITDPDTREGAEQVAAEIRSKALAWLAAQGGTRNDPGDPVEATVRTPGPEADVAASHLAAQPTVISCAACGGKPSALPELALIRMNRKGVPGVWLCQSCIPSGLAAQGKWIADPPATEPPTPDDCLAHRCLVHFKVMSRPEDACPICEMASLRAARATAEERADANYESYERVKGLYSAAEAERERLTRFLISRNERIAQLEGALRDLLATMNPPS